MRVLKSWVKTNKHISWIVHRYFTFLWFCRSRPSGGDWAWSPESESQNTKWETALWHTSAVLVPVFWISALTSSTVVLHDGCLITCWSRWSIWRCSNCWRLAEMSGPKWAHFFKRRDKVWIWWIIGPTLWIKQQTIVVEAGSCSGGSSGWLSCSLIWNQSADGRWCFFQSAGDDLNLKVATSSAGDPNSKDDSAELRQRRELCVGDDARGSSRSTAAPCPTWFAPARYRWWLTGRFMHEQVWTRSIIMCITDSEDVYDQNNMK